MAAESVGAAKRRRDRQLRAFRRHELLTVRMELAAALHHSAQRVEVPREVEEYATYVGPRALKIPPPGMRPASLAEPQGAQERVQRRTMEHVVGFVPVVPLLDAPVPQMVDKLEDVLKIVDLFVPAQEIEVPRISSPSCPPPRRVLPVPQTTEQLVEVPVPSFDQCTRMAFFRDDGGRRWCLLTLPEPRRFSWWLVGTDHEHGTPPAGDHRQHRTEYKYWARMRIFHSLVPGSHCSVLVLPEVDRFMDFSGRRLLVCFPYSVLLGSTVDTRLASVYEAFGRISRSSRVFLWEMTSGLSPYSALSLVRQRIHAVRQSTWLSERISHLLVSGRRLHVVSVFSAELGSTADTCTTSVYRAFECSHLEMTSCLSPYSALSLLLLRIHALHQPTELLEWSPYSALCLVQQWIQVHASYYGGWFALLPTCQAHDALHHGRYGQKDSYAFGSCCTCRFCW